MWKFDDKDQGSYEILKFHKFSQNVLPNIDTSMLISELMSLPHNSHVHVVQKININPTFML